MKAEGPKVHSSGISTMKGQGRSDEPNRSGLGLRSKEPWDRPLGPADCGPRRWAGSDRPRRGPGGDPQHRRLVRNVRHLGLRGPLPDLLGSGLVGTETITSTSGWSGWLGGRVAGRASVILPAGAVFGEHHPDDLLARRPGRSSNAGFPLAMRHNRPDATRSRSVYVTVLLIPWRTNQSNINYQALF